MSAKEDLIRKIQQRANAEQLKERLLSEQNALFASRLPDLYRMIEGAVEGVPGVEVSSQDRSIDMDKRYASLVIEFLGKSIRFDPLNKNGEYGVRAKNLIVAELLFLPAENGAWTAEFMPGEIFNLTEELLIKRLSQLVDDDAKETVKLWD